MGDAPQSAEQSDHEKGIPAGLELQAARQPVQRRVADAPRGQGRHEGAEIFRGQRVELQREASQPASLPDL